MASDKAIAAVGATVVRLLRANCSGALAQGADFALYTPANLAAPMACGLSLLLYRVTPGQAGRNSPVMPDAQGRRLRPALPLELHYLLTPWGDTAERQHLLLGWAMRFLEDHPVLSAAELNAGQPAPAPFGVQEQVEWLSEPLGLAELLALGGRDRLPVSVAYVARPVLLDTGSAAGTPVLRAVPTLRPG